MMTLAQQQTAEAKQRREIVKALGTDAGYAGLMVVLDETCEACGKALRRKSDGTVICERCTKGAY
jgi:uncharacterized Zn finger protein (UPF0148 family)